MVDRRRAANGRPSPTARPGGRVSARERRFQEARRRKRRQWTTAAVAVVVIGLGAALGISLGAGSGAPREALGSLASLGHLVAPPSPGPLGPEGIPIPSAPVLAPPSSTVVGQTIDAIQCNTSEQPLFHIHAHLAIFVDGRQRQVPYGIGIPGARTESTASGRFVDGGRCFYWLHTHADDGIIHIESPVQRTYTLGELFDIWGVALGRDQLGPTRATVVAIVNGGLFKGNPRDIPLDAHSLVQLEVGRPIIAPQVVSFSGTQL